MLNNDMLEMYMVQVRRYDLLSSEEEVLLVSKMKDGDTTSRQRLINGNLRLVVSIAEKYSRDETVLLDLIQEGNMGLLMAADNFSPSFKARFSTYAYPWITQYILRYIQAKIPVIYLPSRKEEEVRRVKKSQSYLYMMLGRQPTLGELAVYLDTSESYIKTVLSYCFACSSIHSEISSGEGPPRVTCADMLEDERSSMEQTGFRNLVANDIRQMVNKLPKEERQVIYYRFNFDKDGTKPQTLQQIGRKFGCSSEKVRKLELKAITSLKKIAGELMSV